MRDARDSTGTSGVASRAARRIPRGCRTVGPFALLLLLCPIVAVEPALSIEAFDGRIQLHGYAEAQVRAIARDFDMGDGLDLTQWYTILNLELEFDIAPDGFGPFDLVSAFVRAEARYDCVWTRACGIFPSADTYGNTAQRLPGRLSDAQRNGYVGVLDPTLTPTVGANGRPTWVNRSDKRPRIRIPLGQNTSPFAWGEFARPTPNQRFLGQAWNVPGIGELFYTVPGLSIGRLDQAGRRENDPGTRDDDASGCFSFSPSPNPCRYPGVYVTENYADYRFGMARTLGPTGGNGVQPFGPWRPRDVVEPWGAIRDRVNPYNPNDVHPVMIDDMGNPLVGQGELPFRPRALLAADTNGNGLVDPLDDAGPFLSRGLYYPTAPLRAALTDPTFGAPDTNFGQRDLAWNRGASQQQTGELKEAYIDLEMFDSRLFLRSGRQDIVWGKTELFRAQDQFNPQDLGLASLPTLEESRIPLWAFRAIYSLYDVGPLEDVRLEGALIFDEFFPVDLGRCGEPYAPNPVCFRGFGLFAHGLTGAGLAGEYRPPAAWDSVDAIEFGGRIEWRWDRYSFSVSSFHGYSDTPHVRQLNVFERNVDPFSGRPRKAGFEGRCTNGTEPSCLGRRVAGDDPTDPAFATFPGLARPRKADVLLNHHGNQQLFATICASTLNASSLLSNACAFNIWNSDQLALEDLGAASPTIAQAFAVMVSGQGYAERFEALAGTPLVFRNILSQTNGKTVLLTLGRWDKDRRDDIANPLYDPSVDPPSAQFEPGPFVPSSGATGPVNPVTGRPGDDDRMPLVPLHINNNLVDGAAVDGGQVSTERLASFPGLRFNGLWAGAGLSPALTAEQEALLGCGDFWGTDCDIQGFDVLNAEASALFQSWPGFEGTGGFAWDSFDGSRPQPGTIRFRGGPTCTRFVGFRQVVLPGCRGAYDYRLDHINQLVIVTYERGYDPTVDGCIFTPSVGGYTVFGFYANGTGVDLSTCAPTANSVIRTLYHPFAGCLTPQEEAVNKECRIVDRDFDAEFLGQVPGKSAQVFRSEMAAVSWNVLQVLVQTSQAPDQVGGKPPPCNPEVPDGCSDRAPRLADFDVNDPQRRDGCSYRRPYLCRNPGAFFGTTGAQRNVVRAGGNGFYGRRDFVWQGGSVVTLDYARRNVVGFSMDFAEDRTKTNWGIEFAWFDRVVMTDNDSETGVADTQHFNLSISVDRPTFVRFLNPSRTFFFNAQVFTRWIQGYGSGFTADGPVTALATFAVSTGYWQDRLLPSLVVVHDFFSISGAVIPSLTYRFSQNFSASVGVGAFWGRVQEKTAALVPIGTPSGGAGPGSQRSYVENGLSPVRSRDELFLRLRYTF